MERRERVEVAVGERRERGREDDDEGGGCEAREAEYGGVCLLGSTQTGDTVLGERRTNVHVHAYSAHTDS